MLRQEHFLIYLKKSNLFRLLIFFAGLAEAGILEGEQSLAG